MIEGRGGRFMSRARIAVVGAGFLFSVLVACTGGPGPLLLGENQDIDPTAEGNGNNTPVPGGSSGSSGGSGSVGGSSGSSGTTTNPPVTATITGLEFDRACNADADCVAVFQGFVCTTCKCPNTAIATKDRARYDSALQTRSTGCAPPGDVACAACENVTAGCDPNTKQCGLGVTSNIVDAGDG
jgi:hypothetical protein